jgi:hypothetical protein
MDEEVVPAPAIIYSIGEEQGPGYAKEIVWSPLGFSRYRRCLLAVVSTNHKLYIFEPVGQVSADMRLLHDLSPLMAEYDVHLPEYDNKEVKKTVMERLRARCRAVAWSPPCRTEGHRWGEALLAAANEFLEIVLFRFFLFLTWGWRGWMLMFAGRRVVGETREIVGHIAPFDAKEVVKWLGKGRVTHAQALRWSPWVHAVERKCEFATPRIQVKVERHDVNGQVDWAFLVYTWNGKAYANKVTIDMADLEAPDVTVDHEPLVLGKAISDRHPIFLTAVAPELIGGRIVVAFAAQMCTTVLTIDENAEIVSTDKFANKFIESVVGMLAAFFLFLGRSVLTEAGLSFAPSETPNTTVIQVFSVKGKSQVITHTVGLKPSAPSKDAAMPDAPTDEELRATASTWPAVLSEAEQDFMAEHEISTAAIRGYGMAVSPLGGITAIAASFHPKDSLEYITAINEKTTIIFGTAPGSSGSWKFYGFTPDGRLPNPIIASTEAVLLEATAFPDKFPTRMRAALSTATSAAQPSLETITYTEGEDVEEFLAKHTLLSTPLNVQQYSAALKTLSFPNGHELLPENPHIIAASIIAALSAPRELCADQLSKRILYSLACVGIMGLYTSPTILQHAKAAFQWLDSQTPEEVRFDLEFGIVEMRMQPQQQQNHQQQNLENGFVSSMERCLICGNGMVWRDLRIAECTEGHRFSRCGLTFLPVTDPKVTRECIVCARTVLGGFVEGEDEEEEEKKVGLAKAVFDGWEACLLCGGRYWAEMS